MISRNRLPVQFAGFKGDWKDDNPHLLDPFSYPCMLSVRYDPSSAACSWKCLSIFSLGTHRLWHLVQTTCMPRTHFPPTDSAATSEAEWCWETFKIPRWIFEHIKIIFTVLQSLQEAAAGPPASDPFSKVLSWCLWPSFDQRDQSNWNIAADRKLYRPQAVIPLQWMFSVRLILSSYRVFNSLNEKRGDDVTQQVSLKDLELCILPGNWVICGSFSIFKNSSPPPAFVHYFCCFYYICLLLYAFLLTNCNHWMQSFNVVFQQLLLSEFPFELFQVSEQFLSS